MRPEETPERDLSERGRDPLDEPLVREGGVFIEPDQHEVSCDTEQEPCAPDDYAADDDEPGEMSIPGTVDDIPLDFGLEFSPASDAHLVLEGPTSESERLRSSLDEPARDDEGELWGAQKALIGEDESSGLDLQGFPEERIPEILEAMGDDAAEALPDYPDGTSATGESGTPSHGGFPERDE